MKVVTFLLVYFPLARPRLSIVPSRVFDSRDQIKKYVLNVQFKQRKLHELVQTRGFKSEFILDLHN